MTVLALVPQCAEPQEQYFELFRMKIAKILQGFAKGTWMQHWAPIEIFSNFPRKTALYLATFQC